MSRRIQKQITKAMTRTVTHVHIPLSRSFDTVETHGIVKAHRRRRRGHCHFLKQRNILSWIFLLIILDIIILRLSFLFLFSLFSLFLFLSFFFLFFFFLSLSLSLLSSCNHSSSLNRTRTTTSLCTTSTLTGTRHTAHSSDAHITPLSSSLRASPSTTSLSPLTSSNSTCSSSIHLIDPNSLP